MVSWTPNACPRRPRHSAPAPARASLLTRISSSYFDVDGIVDQYVTVGSDLDRTGKSGKSWNLDCGTTSQPIVEGIYAKCTIDGVQPFSITAIEGDSA